MSGMLFWDTVILIYFIARYIVLQTFKSKNHVTLTLWKILIDVFNANLFEIDTSNLYKIKRLITYNNNVK